MKISLIFLVIFIALNNASHSKYKYKNYGPSSSSAFWQSSSALNGIGINRYKTLGGSYLSVGNAATLAFGPNQALAEQVAQQVVQATLFPTAQQAAQEALQRNIIGREQVGQEIIEKAVQKVAGIAAAQASQESASPAVDSQASEIAATIARPVIQQAVTEASQNALNQPIGGLGASYNLGGAAGSRWSLFDRISPVFNWNPLNNNIALEGSILAISNQPIAQRVALRAAQLAARESAKVAFQQALQSPLGDSNACELFNIQETVAQIVQESVGQAVQQIAYYQDYAGFSQQGLAGNIPGVAQEAAFNAAKVAAQIGCEKAAETKQQGKFGLALNPLSVVAQQQAAGEIAAEVAEQVVCNKLGGGGICIGALGQSKGNVAATELVAEQAADKIVQESEFKQDSKVQQGIQQIANERQQFAGLSSFGQHSASGVLPLIQRLKEAQAVQAIQNLQRQNQQQQIASTKPKQELENTLQALIQAQITSENVPSQAVITGGNPIYDDKKVVKFNAQLQELVTKNNIEQTKKTIVQAESEAKQLQQQRQLIEQQKQKIENLQNVIGQWRFSPRQAVLLDRAQERLFAREQQLLQELLAQELVIQQLQQVLIEQRNELKSNIVADKVGEELAQLNKYSYRSL